MTPYQHALQLQERERLRKIYKELMEEYDITETEAVRFYWDKVNRNGTEKIYKVRRKKGS